MQCKQNVKILAVPWRYQQQIFQLFITCDRSTAERLGVLTFRFISQCHRLVIQFLTDVLTPEGFSRTGHYTILLSLASNTTHSASSAFRFACTVGGCREPPKQNFWNNSTQIILPASLRKEYQTDEDQERIHVARSMNSVIYASGDRFHEEN